MPLANELWKRRAERLHSRFVEASQRHPKLYYVAARADVTYMWYGLLPGWDSELVDCERLSEVCCEDLWGWIEGEFSVRFGDAPIDQDPHRLRIHGDEWIGRFADSSHREDDSHVYDGIHLFQILGKEAASLLSEERLALSSDGRWPGYPDAIWLEELYSCCKSDEELFDPGESEWEDLGPVDMLWLRWNVFTSSAKAIELLIEEKTRLAETCIVATISYLLFQSFFDQWDVFYRLEGMTREEVGKLVTYLRETSHKRDDRCGGFVEVAFEQDLIEEKEIAKLLSFRKSWEEFRCDLDTLNDEDVGKFQEWLRYLYGLAVGSEKQLIELRARQEPREREKPRWDSECRELWFREKLCKRFRQPAPNQTRLLGAFEESGWPPRMDDPIPPAGNLDQRQRLADTVRGLNKNGVIQFELDGTTEGVIWKPAPENDSDRAPGLDTSS